MSKNALELFQERLAAQAQNKTLSQFVEKNIHLKRGSISFDQHPELKQIYDDTSPIMIFKKCTQGGATTQAVARIFWIGDMLPLKVIYFLPTDKDAAKFVPDRIDSDIISSSPYIRERISDIDSKFQKKYSFSFIYFQGLKSESNVASIDADFIVMDETDISNQKNLKAAKERLDHSNLAWWIMMCKPTVPGFGISEAFETTDQHVRMFKCPKCNHHNDVVDNIRQDVLKHIRKETRKGNDNYFFACTQCGAALDPLQAQWVSKFPGNKIRGYQLSKVYWSWAPPRYQNQAHRLFEKFGDIKDMEDKYSFWRADIGLEFAGDEQPMTAEILDAASRDYNLSPAWPGGLCFAGIDNDDKKRIAIAHQEGFKLVFHFFGEFDGIEEVFPFFRTNNIKKAGIDALPNKDSAKTLALKFKNRVFIQYFKQNQKESEELAKLTKVEVLQVNRTDSLTELIGEFISGVILIPSEKAAGKVMKTVRKHLQMLIKEKVTNAEGIVEYKYKRGVENHYAMAINSAYLAWMQYLGKAPLVISTVPVGGHIPVSGARYESTN